MPEPHAGHDVHPHSHTVWHDGDERMVRDCNGRFWCVSCREWFTGRLCHEPQPRKRSKVAADA